MPGKASNRRTKKISDEINDIEIRKIEFTYGPDDQRRKTVYSENSNIVSKYFAFGNFEETVDETTGDVTKILYISSPDGLVAMRKTVNGTTNMYYVLTDHLGSIDAVVSAVSGTLPAVEYYSFDAWGNRRNPSDWSQTDTRTSFITDRGYTGHEMLNAFGLINANGRIYEPATGRFLSPDDFVQSPDFSQSFNRYAYGFNNPLMFTDPDGEMAWFVPVIVGATIFGTGNLTVHALRGDVNNFGDGLKYFSQGAIAGAVLGATWSFGLASLNGTSIIGRGSIIEGLGFASHGLAQNVGWSIMGSKAVSAITTITGILGSPENSAKIFMGRYYLDENRSFFGGIWQGISRYTWEGLQTSIGYNYTQIRNTYGGVDAVEYLGGATYSIGFNTKHRQGVSLGNNLNIWLRGDSYSILQEPMFMHEYGHTFDSRRFGPFYLFGIGIPSATGASWTEIRANCFASEYFENYYDVDWTPFLNNYPLN